MKITDRIDKRVIAGGIVITMGIIRNLMPSSVWYYPIIYFAFAAGFSFALFEEINGKNLYIIAWISGVIISMDSISFALLEFITKSAAINVDSWQKIISSLITIVFLYLLFYLVGMKNKLDLRKIPIFYFIFFLILCFVDAFTFSMLYVYHLEEMKEYSFIYLFLIFSSIMQMGFILSLAASNSLHKQNEALKEEYLNMQKLHYQYLEEKNTEIRRFRHDMRHHMYMIKEYTDCYDNYELREYLNTMIGKIEYVENYVTVHNGIVDAILNYYSTQFKKIHCPFHVIGNMPMDCEIRAYDLCTIFANILSNAYEASEHAKTKYVELRLGYEDHVLFIYQKNAFEGKRATKGHGIKTSKPEQDQHGLGMDNIREGVEKYQGTLEFRIEENFFILEIIMETFVS